MDWSGFAIEFVMNIEDAKKEKGIQLLLQPFDFMVGTVRFELTTSTVSG